MYNTDGCMSFAFDGLPTDELFFSRCTVPLFKKTIYSFNFSFVWVFRTLSCFGPLGRLLISSRRTLFTINLYGPPARPASHPRTLFNTQKHLKIVCAIFTTQRRDLPTWKSNSTKRRLDKRHWTQSTGTKLSSHDQSGLDIMGYITLRGTTSNS